MLGADGHALVGADMHHDPATLGPHPPGPPVPVESPSDTMLASSDGRTPPQDIYYTDYEKFDNPGYYHRHGSPPGPPAGHAAPSAPGASAAGVCAGCGEAITDRYYLMTVEKSWHLHCLLCVDCQRPLDSQVTCYAKDGHIYCKEDYYRRFAVKQCARCRMTIASHELVMRARHLVFHLNCFTCAVCMKVLTPGEHFGMHFDAVYCRLHYEEILCGTGNTDLHLRELDGFHGNGHVRMYNGVGGAQKGRPRKRKAVSELDLIPNPIGRIPLDGDFCGDLDISGLHGSGGYGTNKHKRMRTSFKHNQLRTMRTYFSLNHNPDAKDLKDLSQKTGLSKKVLQVWFQNARAKYRRSLLKQDQNGIKEEPNNNGENLSQDKMTDVVKNFNSRSPGALSDISSSASLSDLSRDQDMKNTSGSCLTDLCQGRP